MLYLDIKGTSDLDCPYIDIDTGWVNRIFKHLPEKAWDNTIINMNICVEYGTGDLWYSRVRTFEGSCCAEYILTSRKPRKNNRRELVNNPEDQLLGFDTVRETVFGIANCDIRYLLRSWGVEFDEDDDEIYILYKRIIREVFFKMCEDMKVC